MAIPVKEILAAAAELIGRSDLAREADGDSSSSELSLLLRCFNLVENEVALEYFPLVKEDTVLASSSRVAYTALSSVPVSIRSVCSVTTGKELNFEVHPDYIAVPSLGTVAVTYAYAPAAKKLGENSDYTGSKISARLLSYGVAAEFLVACGRFTEASVFDQKYRAALAAACSPGKALVMRERRWA